MPESHQIATVVKISGKAYLKTPDGKMTLLIVGDVLHEGEVVVTAIDGRVELDFGGGSFLVLPAEQTTLITAEIADSFALYNEDIIDEEPHIETIFEALGVQERSSGFTGGIGNDGNNFVRLERIAQVLAPARLETEGIETPDSVVFDVAFQSDDEDPTRSTPPNKPALPTIAVDDVSVDEDAGTATFTVRLSHAPAATVTFDYTTSGGSATAGADYDDASGTLTFAPRGPLTQTITVNITDDAIYEGNEQFFVNLSNIRGATILNTQGVGSIADNDTTSFSIGNVSISEGGLMTFTVTRTGDAEADQTVDFATSIEAGDNSELADFTGNSGTLTFASGVTSQTFTVQTTQDAIFEGSETFTATLSNNSAGSSI
ncbi:Calx-beta domain-containing protein, partial [Trichloromonas sp.]|uniref:Calx-beta domain-containing protein n=1 Tax=Trichloromonas sp. TaxID=3069249 RepID=UPI003D81307D